MIVGYARVSTAEQAINSFALEQQIKRLNNFGVDRVYFDVDSGKKDKRVNFQKLIDEIQADLISGVAVTRLDRLTRSLFTQKQFLDLCEKKGVPITALDQNIDTSTATGKFQLNMLGSFAEMESDIISERVKYGHAYHKKQKLPYFAPFGYIKVVDHFELDTVPFLCLIKGKIEMSRADIARDLIRSFLDGEGSLTKTLQLFHRKYGLFIQSYKGSGNRKQRGTLGFTTSGFGNWLVNPILRGHLAYGRAYSGSLTNKDKWEIIYNTHPDHILLSDQEYQQIEVILQTNKALGGWGKKLDIKKQPLSGLVYCANCGSRCKVSSFKLRTDPTVKKYSYQCIGYIRGTCASKKSIRADSLLDSVIQSMTEKAQQILNNEKYDELETPKILELRKELRQLKNIVAPSMIIIDTIKRIEIEIEKARLESNFQAQTINENKQDLLQYFQDVVFWDTYLKYQLSPEQLQLLYHKFIDKILVSYGRLEKIIFKI